MSPPDSAVVAVVDSVVAAAVSVARQVQDSGVQVVAASGLGFEELA